MLPETPQGFSHNPLTASNEEMWAPLSRRNFLKISLSVGGSLLVGFAGGNDVAVAAELSKHGAWEPDAWIRIDPSNRVTLVIPQVEMGQGITTTLAALLAEELEVDLAQIQWESAPLDERYRHPLLGAQMTYGSTSVRAWWNPLRQAGAAARQLLLTAAAQAWGVSVADCVAENGVVKHSSGKQKRYGDLLEKASQLEAPSQIVLKKLEHYRYIGKPQKRLDTADKVRGNARFGIDVQFKELLTAVVVRPPVRGATLKSSDASAIRIPGVKTVVEMESAVAIVASNYHSAHKARAQLKVEWDTGDREAAQVQQSIGSIGTEQGELLQSRPDHYPQLATSVGSLEALSASMDKASKRLSATYQSPFLAHACMETMNCTAWVSTEGEEQRCQIWVPTQNQSGVGQLAAEITGLPLEKIQVHTTYLGGGYGRRLALDFVRYAIEISRRMQKPVKVVYSREDDLKAGYYRPSSRIELAAGLDSQGQWTAWTAFTAAPVLVDDGIGGPALPHSSNVLKTAIDRWALQGLEDSPYGIPQQKTTWFQQKTPALDGLTGIWPGGGYSQNVFARECFVDELAELVGQNPLVFRRNQLKSQPRLIRVLELLAEKSGKKNWLDAGLNKFAVESSKEGVKMGSGLAIHAADGSVIAMMVEVVQQKGKLRVPRVVCAIDAGQIVSPAMVTRQIESAVAFALSAALYQQITLQNGQTQQSSFADYPILRFSEMPFVEVHTVPSTAEPGGISDLAVPPVAPALANAVFVLTGKRHRRLPLSVS